MKLSRLFLILPLAAVIMTMTGCPNQSHCLLGQEVVIPQTDSTDPIVTMDFHLPNGSIVTVTPGSATSTVSVPGGGNVTVMVNAKDGEGVRDSQIWAASITERIDPNTGTVSRPGPGLLGAPTASNADNGSPGQKGCTERLASTNLAVSKSATGSVSFEVTAAAVNFGGKTVRTTAVILAAQ
jgi:hypothetical protein